ncbi:MAG: HAD hydrolase family protein [Candidatus Marinimicrobia bacterium]|nr:HAD hydrolase family protein [Candidatus Neomarinimicrobiota bacterium]
MARHDKIIAVDIDGTICTIEEDYSRCELIDGSREALLMLQEKGFKIYLHTGRHIDKYDITVSWLKKHNVAYNYIVFGKPNAQYYIDDKAIKFNTWSEVISEIG